MTVAIAARGLATGAPGFRHRTGQRARCEVAKRGEEAIQIWFRSLIRGRDNPLKDTEPVGDLGDERLVDDPGRELVGKEPGD